MSGQFMDFDSTHIQQSKLSNKYFLHKKNIKKTQVDIENYIRSVN